MFGALANEGLIKAAQGTVSTFYCSWQNLGLCNSQNMQGCAAVTNNPQIQVT